jgi:hypothetical protein
LKYTCRHHASCVDGLTVSLFQWIGKELEAAGGDAFVCEARLVEGITDAQLRALFDQARDAEYRALSQEAATAARSLSGKRGATADALARARSALPRLRKRVAEIGAVDFFGANGGKAAEIALRELEEHLLRSDRKKPEPKSAETAKDTLKDLKGKVWVTRERVHVDRIACAWLIRTFGRPEAAGIRQLLTGITLDTDDDPTRIARGSELFNNLYRSLQRRSAGGAGKR